MVILNLMHINIREYGRGNQKWTMQRETGNTVHTIRRKTQHNMCWTSLYRNKHK